MPLQEFYRVEIFKVGQALQSRDEVVGRAFLCAVEYFAGNDYL